MFTFRRQPIPLRSCLDRYWNFDPWLHAVDVLPLAASLPGACGPALRTFASRELDAGWVQYLTGSLRRWSAFRGKAARSGAPATLWGRAEKFRRLFPSFVVSIQSIAPRPRLSLMTKAELYRFAANVPACFAQFAKAIKGSDSDVLPSKAAHLALPGLVPAFDQARIRGLVLPRLLGRGSRNYRAYLELSWWALHELRRSQDLDRALKITRQRLIEQLQSQWPRHLLRAASPLLDLPPLLRLDACVSEYVLMGLARVGAERQGRGPAWPILRRTV
jgi:hypothetical protein